MLDNYVRKSRQQLVVQASVSHSKNGMASFVRFVVALLSYAVAVALVLLSNSLVGRLEGNSSFLKSALLALIVVISLLLWLSARLEKGALRLWLAWCALLALVYVSIAVAGGSTGGRGIVYLFLLLGVFPLLLYLLDASQCLGMFLQSFVNVVAALALVSLALWLLGPIFGTIQPNVAITNDWNGMGVVGASRGYYHLLYVTQTQAIGSFVVVRNTGLFTEAPMYSYVLCMALLFECMLVKRPRKPLVCILVLTVLTTFSSTGYLVLIMLAASSVFNFQGPERTRPMTMIGLAVFAVISVALGFQILGEKLASSSGLTRMDDFAAGFAAWGNDYLFGNGFGSGDVVKGYMSGFRSNNLGFSNSPMAVLARGGIVFMLPFLVGFGGLLLPGGRRERLFGAMFAFIWTVTIVWSLPLTAMSFGFGLFRVMRCMPAHGHYGYGFKTDALIGPC